MNPREDDGLATMLIVAALCIALGTLMIWAPGANDATGASELWRVARRDGPRPPGLR